MGSAESLVMGPPVAALLGRDPIALAATNAIYRRWWQVEQHAADAHCLKIQPFQQVAWQRAAWAVGELIKRSVGMQLPLEHALDDRRDLTGRHRQQRQPADHGAGPLVAEYGESFAKPRGIHAEHMGARIA